MTEPSFIRSFSFAPGSTSTVSPTCTASPNFSRLLRPPVSTKHCPNRASTSLACGPAIADFRIGDGGESRDATLSLGEGLLRAVVPALKAPPHFEVDTATGVAAVRSTDWFIEARPGSTQVGVLEGRVSLRSVATGQEIVIPARWGARVEAARDPVPARVWTSAEFDDFIRRTNLE